MAVKKSLIMDANIENDVEFLYGDFRDASLSKYETFGYTIKCSSQPDAEYLNATGYLHDTIQTYFSRNNIPQKGAKIKLLKAQSGKKVEWKINGMTQKEMCSTAPPVKTQAPLNTNGATPVVSQPQSRVQGAGSSSHKVSKAEASKGLETIYSVIYDNNLRLQRIEENQNKLLSLYLSGNKVVGNDEEMPF
tara:strand:- start:6076 stop:6648 length:573 start_codon:yes stop_codon:yes gene_type:complete